MMQGSKIPFQTNQSLTALDDSFWGRFSGSWLWMCLSSAIRVIGFSAQAARLCHSGVRQSSSGFHLFWLRAIIGSIFSRKSCRPCSLHWIAMQVRPSLLVYSTA